MGPLLRQVRCTSSCTKGVLIRRRVWSDAAFHLPAEIRRVVLWHVAVWRDGGYGGDGGDGWDRVSLFTVQ